MNTEALKIILNQFKDGSLDIDNTVILINELFNKVTYIPYQPWTQPYYETIWKQTYPKYEITCSL